MKRSAVGASAPPTEPWSRLLGICALWLCTATALAAELPTLTARVTDLTGTLHTQQVASLEQKLAALEQRKGSQVAVVVVPTTQPETIEQYAVTLFEQNAIGRKGVDDGVLLLVAKDDRKVRIEVGYGLEGAIPDAYANRIIAEYLTPKFRAGDFYGGIDEATGAIAKLVEGEALPEPLAEPTSTRRDLSGELFLAGLFGFISAQLMAAFVRRRTAARVVSSVVVAAIAAAWVIQQWLPTGFAGIVALFAAAMSVPPGGAIGRGGFPRGGSWGGGGGSSGGGGWSGGGGRSGGGGASGSW